MSTARRYAPVSWRWGRSASARSRPSRASAPPRPAPRCRRHGWIWRWSNAATANPGRSCRRRRCSTPPRTPKIPTSMRPWRETFAAAGPTCVSARRSNMRPKPNSAPRESAMYDSTVQESNPSADAALTRRGFLQAGLAVGGILMVGFHLPMARGAQSEKPAFAPNAFIRIDGKGKITLIMPQVEMGQGIYTAIAMILAEELDAAFDQVVLEAAPPNDKLYANPTFGLQVTGNSNSIRAFWMPLRKAAAGAREMLVQTAAQIWKADPAGIRTDSSTAFHDASGRQLAYAALADRAGNLTAPQNPTLKDPKDFKLIGKPLKRLDTPDKVNGKLVYSIDVMPPGVKFATLAACPVFGGKVGTVDDSKAKSLPGVRQVVVLDDLVAVVGDHMWAAKQGLAALNVTWNEGANAAISSADVWKQIRAASRQEGAVANNQGDAAKGLSQGELHEAVYEMPFLAHATMEPLNCTVHVTPTSCEVWVGIQV